MTTGSQTAAHAVIAAEESRMAALESLSMRERQVARLVATGLTNKEIGTELFIAEQTVKNIITSAMRKMGVSRRVGLAVAAVDAAAVTRSALALVLSGPASESDRALAAGVRGVAARFGTDPTSLLLELSEGSAR